MKINNTIIAPVLKAILLAILIEGCAQRFGMNREIGLGREKFDVFNEFTKLVESSPLDSDGTQRFLDQHREAMSETYVWKDADHTFLHYAAKKGMLELVNELVIKRKVPVDIKTKDSGVTPLHCAAKYGHTEVVEFLLKNGANIYETDNQQLNVLHYAALSGQKAVFKQLYDNMDVDKMDNITKKSRWRPNFLHWIALSVNTPDDDKPIDQIRDLAKFIIQKYGPTIIQELDNKGCTSLQVAALSGNLPLIELLIEYDVVRSLPSQKIRSAARVAHKEGHYEIENLINDQLIPNQD